MGIIATSQIADISVLSKTARGSPYYISASVTVVRNLSTIQETERKTRVKEVEASALSESIGQTMFNCCRRQRVQLGFE